MNFVSYRNRRQDLYVHIISWCGLLQNSIFVPGAVQFCRSCWIYLTNHCRDKCLSLEDAMEESHFSPIFPEKMTFKPLSPCAFYKHDSCFPLASDKQGLMCPCRETILVGDESPQSLLEHALHCISQCCSAEVGATAGWQGKDECSCHLRLCCWAQHRKFCGHFSPAAASFVLPAVSWAASTLMEGIAELTEKPWFPLSPEADHDRGLLKLKNSRHTASSVFTAQLFKIQLILLTVPESLSSPCHQQHQFV